jgi:hypothetical protein
MGRGPLYVYKEGDNYKEKKLFQKKVVPVDGRIEMVWDAHVPRTSIDTLKEGEELKVCFALEIIRGKLVQESAPAAICFSYILNYEQKVNQDDSYTLESTDKSFSQTLTARDDAIKDDAYITLQFKDILPNKDYSLCYKNNGDEFYEWENIPFAQLIGL